MNELLLAILTSSLTDIQKEIIESFLFNVLVKERLDKQKEYIQTVISDEIANMNEQDIISMLKDRIGYVKRN